MRQKVGLGYTPQWEGAVKCWARNYLYKNKWRCDPILEMADLEQEAFLLYMKVVDYYPAVKEEPHFISLYQTALRNLVTEYSRKMKDRKGALVDAEADAPEFANWGQVAALLGDASTELKLALAVFSDDAKLATLTAETKRPKFSR